MLQKAFRQAFTIRRAQCLGLAIATLGLLAGNAAALQSVHVVNGGSGAALQTAIDSAADGDTVLVHGGNFDAIQIVGRTLCVISEPELSTTVAGLRISGTVLTQRTTIAGLKVVAPPMASLIAPDCIRVEQCAGSVRLEKMEAGLTTPNGKPALSVDQCTDMAIFSCALSGSDGAVTTQNLSAWTPGAGIVSTQSQLAIYDSTIRGGKGMDGFIQSICSNPYVFYNTPGAAGIELDATSFVHASASSFIGGLGGHGVNAYCNCTFGQLVPGTVGAAGGNSIVNQVTSVVELIDGQLQPGAGGAGALPANCGGGPGGAAGPGAPGSTNTQPVNVLAASALKMTGPIAVRTGQQLNCAVVGTPGDLVLLRCAFDATFFPVLPLSGVMLTARRAPRIAGGFIPAGGQLQLSVTPSPLPLGVDGQQWFLQALGRSPVGVFQLGGSFVVTVLDPSF